MSYTQATLTLVMALCLSTSLHANPLSVSTSSTSGAAPTLSTVIPQAELHVRELPALTGTGEQLVAPEPIGADAPSLLDDVKQLEPVPFDASKNLDLTEYEDLLDEMALTDEQKKLWDAVVLAYDLRAQDGAEYNNIVGTLGSATKELELVQKILAQSLLDPLSQNDFRFAMLVPREMAVVAFEKLYFELSDNQIKKFEDYIKKLIIKKQPPPATTD